MATISSGRRNQQIESIQTRQISGQTLKDDKVKCMISHALRNDTSATHTNAVVCASYKQRECVDESDKDDDHDHDDDDDGERSDSEEDLVLDDLDESAESGDSEIEKNEDQPELFDQVILRSERLAIRWQSRSLVRN